MAAGQQVPNGESSMWGDYHLREVALYVKRIADFTGDDTETLLTLANLRGMKESGTLFAFPTYLYIFTVASMVLFGLYKIYFGEIGELPQSCGVR